MKPLICRRGAGAVSCALLAASVGVVSGRSAADPPVEMCGFGGFSTSVSGLPEHAAEAWGATVLVSATAFIRTTTPQMKTKTKRGAGFVLRVLDEPNRRRDTAHIVTNAHVLSFGRSKLRVWVGFASEKDPDRQVWSSRARILAISSSQDLAFLEVKIPRDAAVVVPRLADPACIDRAASGVVSVGWPNLSRKKNWRGAPPANRSDHIKRYSQGAFRSVFGDYQLTSSAKIEMDRMAVVFHDADLLPGSSGGPLVNGAGEVIGINTLAVGDSDDIQHCLSSTAGAHDAGAGWAHLAISATEIVREYRRSVSRDLDINLCGAPATTEMLQTAGLAQDTVRERSPAF